jgi:hypothetical protein
MKESAKTGAVAMQAGFAVKKRLAAKRSYLLVPHVLEGVRDSKTEPSIFYIIHRQANHRPAIRNRFLGATPANAHAA